MRSGSTEEFEPAPYVFTLLNALLWLYYGVTKPDGLLVATVNGFGAVMEAIYVVLFIVYAANHATRVREGRDHTYNSISLALLRPCLVPSQSVALLPRTWLCTQFIIVSIFKHHSLICCYTYHMFDFNPF